MWQVLFVTLTTTQRASATRIKALPCGGGFTSQSGCFCRHKHCTSLVATATASAQRKLLCGWICALCRRLCTFTPFANALPQMLIKKRSATQERAPSDALYGARALELHKIIITLINRAPTGLLRSACRMRVESELSLAPPSNSTGGAPQSKPSARDDGADDRLRPLAGSACYVAMRCGAAAAADSRRFRGA